MNYSLFATKKGKCDACKDETKGDEILEKVNIKGYEFFFCDDCVIGLRDATPDENDEFVQRYERRQKIVRV